MLLMVSSLSLSLILPLFAFIFFNFRCIASKQYTRACIRGSMDKELPGETSPFKNRREKIRVARSRTVRKQEYNGIFFYTNIFSVETQEWAHSRDNEKLIIKIRWQLI